MAVSDAQVWLTIIAALVALSVVIWLIQEAAKRAGQMRCPACRELIRNDATKCRFCGTTLAAVLLAMIVLPLLADPVRTDPDKFTTVFTDGDQIVTLADKNLTMSHMTAAMNIKEFGKPRERNAANSFVGLGYKSYWVRTRMVDGRLICEKFALRPDTDEERVARAAELFKVGCS